MEGVNGKPFVTTQYALVAVGKAEKPWPFLACSNSKFTEVGNAPANLMITKLIWIGGVLSVEKDHER